MKFVTHARLKRLVRSEWDLFTPSELRLSPSPGSLGRGSHARKPQVEDQRCSTECIKKPTFTGKLLLFCTSFMNLFAFARVSLGLKCLLSILFLFFFFKASSDVTSFLSSSKTSLAALSLSLTPILPGPGTVIYLAHRRSSYFADSFL